jgi:hypothetical protein
MPIESEFLTFSADKLLELVGRIEDCVEKLTLNRCGRADRNIRTRWGICCCT